MKEDLKPLVLGLGALSLVLLALLLLLIVCIHKHKREAAGDGKKVRNRSHKPISLCLLIYLSSRSKVSRAESWRYESSIYVQVNLHQSPLNI